jgi:DNA-binding PadR family transcriptional regulator
MGRLQTPSGIYRSFLRGILQVFILHHAARGPLHGGAVTRGFRLLGYPLSPGTLYPILHALQQERLLRSRTRVISGRSYRFYTLTPRGLKALTCLHKSLRDILLDVLGSEGALRGQGPGSHASLVERPAATQRPIRSKRR